MKHHKSVDVCIPRKTMSINVTVNGNPIKIHRGRMVVTDKNKEYDKRRKMRIQQVRQQSKDIAASVRSGVKQTTTTDTSETQRRSQSKVEWRNRKVCLPHPQQNEVLDDIGIPMRSARFLEKEETEERQRRETENNFRAEQRGHKAHRILEVERKEANLKIAIPRQTKQIVREFEDARAAMIVQYGNNRRPNKIKTKNSKKKEKNEEPVTAVADESLAEKEDDIQEENPQEQTSNTIPNSSKSQEIIPSTQSLLVSKDSVKEQEIPAKVKILQVESLNTVDKEVKASSVAFKRPSVVLADVDVHPIISHGIQLDTRISDRIRRRHLTSFHPAPAMSDIPEVPSKECDVSMKESQEDKENVDVAGNPSRVTKNRKLSKATHQGVSIHPEPSQSHEGTRQTITACPICLQIANPLLHLQAAPCAAHQCCYYPPGYQVPVDVQPQQGPTQANTSEACIRPDSIEIPHKPMVAIARPPYQAQYSAQDTDNVQYQQIKCFDWNNRFASKIVTDKVQVQPVSNQDLVYGELCEDESHQAGSSRTNQFSKIADERTKMADLRGKQAMQRQKARKDHKTLMQKMPLLQKQDRIAQLNPAKDRFHYSDERKKEHEKQRQQDLEQAFERIVPTKITIPARGGKRPESGQPKTGHVCTTDENCICKECPKLKQNKNKEVTPESRDETDESGKAGLNQLLEKLKSQKEELLKECKALPKNSNFFNLIDDLDFTCKGTQPCDDKHVQTESQTANEKDKSKECRKTCPVKKLKKALILQNISTQTSPLRRETLPGTSSSSDSTEPTPPKQAKTTLKCTCEDEDPLCEIRIKVASKCKQIQTKSGEKLPEVILRPCNTVEDILHLESLQNAPKPESKRTKKSEMKRARSESPKKSLPPKPQSPKKVSMPRNMAKAPRQEPSKVSSQSKRQKEPTKVVIAKSVKLDPVKATEEPISYTSYYSPPDYNNPHRVCKRKAIKDELAASANLLPYINKLLAMSRKNLESIPVDCDCMSDVPTPSSSVVNASPNRRPQRRSNSNEDLTDSSPTEMLSVMLKRFNLTPKDLHTFISRSTTISSSATRTRSNSMASTSSPNDPFVTPAMQKLGANQQNVNMIGQFTRRSEAYIQRINDLSAKIQQVRKEKEEMLKSKDGGQKTSYKTLPDAESSPDSKAASKADSPSLEQKELNAQLLFMDPDQFNFDIPAPVAQSDRNEELQLLLECNEIEPDMDKDTVERYMKLVGYELKKGTTTKPTEMEEATPIMRRTEQTFAAMLDIPKLPKFVPQPSTKRKPPVTGQAMRYNEIFHELSAIPEAESSRLSKSPQSPRKKVVETVEIDSSENDKTSEPVEEMLKNIGLDWAIPAVRKATVANILDSSSSSSSLGTSIRNFAYVHKMHNGSSSSEQSPGCRTSTPVQTGNIPNQSAKLDQDVQELSPVIKESDLRTEKSPKPSKADRVQHASYQTLRNITMSSDKSNT